MNYLVPQDAESTVLNTDVDDLFNANAVAFASANTLALQPPFSTKLLTTLPEDQALAAAHASKFLAGWGFGVTGAFLSGLNSMASFVTAISASGLLPAAKVLDTAAPATTDFQTNLSDFRAYLTAVKASCCKVSTNTQSILGNMQAVHDKLSALADQADDDNTRLSTAVKEVDADGTIDKLLAQQSQLQSQFADVNAQIAKGATTTIAQDIEFGFSFAKEFIDGITPGAIGGSALGLAGEVEAIQQFEEQNKALMEKQADLGAQIVALEETIAQDKADRLELTLAAAQIDIFTKQVHALLGFAGSVVEQMKGWANQLDLFSIQSAPPSAGFYEAQVAAGQTFWAALSSTTARYQQILALSTR